MLVKHNLAPLKFNLADNKWDTWRVGEIKKDGDIFTLTCKNNINYQLVLTVQKPKSEKFSIVVVVENLGEDNLIVGSNASKDSDVNIAPHTKRKLKFTETVSKSVTQFLFYCYPNKTIKLKAYALMVIDGDIMPDVYIPPQSALPQDKQALYPPEGNYKEIYAL